MKRGIPVILSEHSCRIIQAALEGKPISQDEAKRLILYIEKAIGG